MSEGGKRPPKSYGGYELNGEEQRVSFGPRDMVLWERAHKGAPFVTSDGGAHFERQAWLIWGSAKRAGLHDLDFNTWLNSIEDVWVEAPDDDDDPDPEGYGDPTGGSGLDNLSS